MGGPSGASLEDSEDKDMATALMSLREVARYLHMQERTIYDWAQTGRIPVFKLGATWRFRRSEIDAWLETQRSGPDVSSAKPPLVPPVGAPVTHWQRVRECAGEIETAMGDESRTVVVLDEFVDQFGDDVVRAAVDRLRKEKGAIVSYEEGPDSQKVRVIRRR